MNDDDLMMSGNDRAYDDDIAWADMSNMEKTGKPSE